MTENNYNDCLFGSDFCRPLEKWRENITDGTSPRRSGVNFQSDSLDGLARSFSSNDLSLSLMAGSKSKMKVELANDKLWRVFRDNETEMIITRAGR